MPKAPQLDDERASGEQVTVSVAVAAANAFPKPDTNSVTEPAIEATAAEVEKPLEPVPNEAPDVTSPELQTAPEADAAAEAEATPSPAREPTSETALSTTVQVARLADDASRAQLIEDTSSAAPAESSNTAEPVESTDSAKPVESSKTVKPVETTDTAKPVAEPRKKKQANKKIQKKKKAAARKKRKKAKRRAEKNSTARNSASSRRNGSNSSNAGSRGKSNRAAGRARLASYLGRVKSKIRRQNRGAKASGVSVVSFSIAGSGNVVRVRLKRSSGNATLDKAAVRMVRRAAPFGPIPPDVGRRKLSLSVPIRFRLR
ncbi:MAG: TonB family protein [Pseudomonadota bacterium]